MNAAQLTQEADAFLSFVTQLHGLYLDASLGFERNAEFARERQYQYTHRARERQHFIEIEQLDQAVWEYNYVAEGEPARSQHTTTFGTFKARNGMTGPNARFFASLCVSTIFHYWEDHFRERIADALGVEKGAVKVPILGDLRLYRQAIVHNKGIATKDMERCTEIKWFMQGERIELYPNQVDEIFQKIVQEIEDFVDQTLKAA